MEWYQAYLNAIQKLPSDGEQSEFNVEEQTDVLKALLLQEISSLKKVRNEDQIELIATMVGMFPADAKKCLRFLSRFEGDRVGSIWKKILQPIFNFDGSEEIGSITEQEVTEC